MTPRARLTHAASFLSRALAVVSVLGSLAVLAVLHVPPALADSPAPAVASSYAVALTSGFSNSLLDAEAAAWSKATSIEWGPAPYATRFRALWSDAGLHLRFDAADAAPWHTMTKRDEQLWDEEVVEIFLDPDGSGRDYYELELNPANVVCDLRMISPWPDKKGDIDWNLSGLETRVRLDRDPAGRTRGWTATAFLPWSGLRALPSAARVALPPAPGDAWRFNVFRIKRPGGKASPEKDAVFAAWSPPSVRSFHDAGAFRPLVFTGPPR